MSNDGTPIRIGSAKPTAPHNRDPRWADEEFEPDPGKGDVVPRVDPQPPQQIPFGPLRNK